MNTCVKILITILRSQMEDMKDDERIELKNSIMDGYCEYCGSKYLPCYCRRDE